MKEKSFSKKHITLARRVAGDGFCHFAGGFPPFLAAWGGQTEREPAFLNVRLHAAFFQAVLGVRIWINGSFSPTQMSDGLFLLGKPVRINAPCYDLI